MNRKVSKQENDMVIDLRQCWDRGGHMYYHPFIGPYALSKKLMSALNSLGFKIRSGARLPDALFDEYVLFAVEPDDNQEERFVTSDYWYTVRS